MAAAKKVLKGINIQSYTSAFEQSQQMPSDSEIERMKYMIADLKPKVEEVKKLYGKLNALLKVREKTLQLINDAIDYLNKEHRNVNIAKVTGSSVSLVGDGLVIGGAIAAPFTFGISLIATAAGGAVCAVGGATSAGAGLVELYRTKKKVAEIQEAVEEDNKFSEEVKRMWEGIMGTCTRVAKKHSSHTRLTPEDVLSVLFVCCINNVPDKLLTKAPKVFKEKLKEHTERHEETSAHAMDVGFGIGSGAKSMVMSGRATAGVVLTALVVKFADKGSKAVCHCAKMGGISRKVVIAAKVFRIATGINPVISIALSTVGSVVDIASLIYGAYQIHKKSDSSAGKELKKKRDELKESREQLKKLKDCLSDVINSLHI